MAEKRDAAAAGGAAGAGAEAKKAKPSGDAAGGERGAFMAAFARLKGALLEDALVSEATASGGADGEGKTAAQRWMDEMLEYNVPGGKLNRGISVVDTIRVLMEHGCGGGARDAAHEAELLFQARVVGWCIEWLQAFFLVADDIMDGSVTRRGQPCWYLVDHVKMNACNDCILLECHIYRLLKMFVAGSRCYAQILDLFHDVTYQTSVGQMLDLITAPVGKADLSKYTLETYKNIVKYKTAFYSFVLPVCSAMLLLGVDGAREHEIAREVLLPMGEYFQVQDDFLDAFGDPEVIGKVRASTERGCPPAGARVRFPTLINPHQPPARTPIPARLGNGRRRQVGTDIEDSKCSWLIVQVMRRASEAQMAVVKAHYGGSGAESVAAIKALYREMGIEQVYRDYEQECYASLTKMIGDQDKLPKEVFTKFLEKIFKRSK